MKSWGERLIGGLKKWRSQKNNVSAGEKPNTSQTNPVKLDHEPHVELSVAEIIAHDFKGTNVDTVPQATPKTLAEQANVDEPKTFQSPERTLLTTEKRAEEFSPSTSKTRQMPPRVRQQTAKDAQKRQQIVSSGEEGTSIGAIPDKQMKKAESISLRGHSSPDSEPLTNIAQEMPGTAGDAPMVTATNNTAASLVADKPSLEKRPIPGGAKNRDKIPQLTKSFSSPKTVSKRLQSGTKETEYGAVSDAELEELEAENTRLKLLISKRSTGETSEA